MTGRYNMQIEAPLSESMADTAWHVHRAMNEQKEQYAFLESFRSMIASLANGDSVAKTAASRTGALSCPGNFLHQPCRY